MTDYDFLTEGQWDSISNLVLALILVFLPILAMLVAYVLTHKPPPSVC